MRNEKPGELEIHGEANEKSIVSVAKNLTENKIVLIDIDEFEFHLLSKGVLAALGECVVIIEIHNWIDGFEDRYPALLRDIERFFEIAIIAPSEKHPQNIDLLRSYTDDNRLLVSSERRPCLMRFLHLTPKKNR